MNDAEATTSAKQVTLLLEGIAKGHQGAKEELIRILYKDMRRVAFSLGVDQNGTLSPTVLVHDAYMRLVNNNNSFQNRFQFISAVSQVMRNLIIDYSRYKKAEKRGGKIDKVSLQYAIGEKSQHHDLAKLADALQELEQANPRQAKVLQLRFFGGLTLAEISRGLGLATSTISLDLKAGLAWMKWYLKS